MMKKIKSIMIIMLMISLIFSIKVFAGDQENPEIEDEIGDSYFDFLDIKSAWFFEDENEPEYLFISMKMNSINENFISIFAVKWHLQDTKYIAGLETYFIKPKISRSGLYQRGTSWQWRSMPECGSIMDKNNNIMTWKILKTNIGDPQPGYILTKTQASAVASFPMSIFDPFIDMRDFAPNDTNEYGKDYTIQY